MVTRRFGDGNVIRGPLPDEGTLVDVGSEVAETVAEGSSPSTTTVDDVNTIRSTGATVRYNYQMRVEGASINSSILPVVRYESLNPSVATVDSNGFVTWVSDGQAKIRVTGQRGMKALFCPAVSQTTGAVSDDPQSFVDGSLAKAGIGGVDTAYVAGSESTQWSIFSTKGNGSVDFVRNENLWLDVHSQMACESAWNSLSGDQRKLILITPQHALGVKHWPGNYVGATYDWIDTDNNRVSRTITHEEVWPGEDWSADFRVFRLDSPISTITPATIAPTTFTNHFGALVHKTAYDGGVVVLPVLHTNQDDLLIVADYNYAYNIRAGVTRQYTKFNKAARVGDSGCGVFLWTGTKLMLIFTFTSTVGGRSPADWEDWINSAIAGVDADAGDATGHTLTIGGLSSFPTY